MALTVHAQLKGRACVLKGADQNLLCSTHGQQTATSKQLNAFIFYFEKHVLRNNNKTNQTGSQISEDHQSWLPLVININVIQKHKRNTKWKTATTTHYLQRKWNVSSTPAAKYWNAALMLKRTTCVHYHLRQAGQFTWPTRPLSVRQFARQQNYRNSYRQIPLELHLAISELWFGQEWEGILLELLCSSSIIVYLPIVARSLEQLTGLVYQILLHLTGFTHCA